MKSGLDGDHACWHVGHSRLPDGDPESQGSAPQLVQVASTLRATTPSAWTATVESGADGSNGIGAARSSSYGSACALSFLRTHPPKENRRDEGQDGGCQSVKGVAQRANSGKGRT